MLRDHLLVSIQHGITDSSLHCIWAWATQLCITELHRERRTSLRHCRVRLAILGTLAKARLPGPSTPAHITVVVDPMAVVAGRISLHSGPSPSTRFRYCTMHVIRAAE